MAGAAKALEQTLDYILYDMSYANMLLYTSCLPTYHKSDKTKLEEGRNEEIINADDPKNRDLIRQIIEQS